jgi:manganese transport protein
MSATLFAVALLMSGLASSAVGTYAGAVVVDGFSPWRLGPFARRMVTLAPTLLVVASGVDPTRALVLSQVVLSFGVPFALWPLVALTRDRSVMGGFVNDRTTTGFAVVAAAAITAVNVLLLVLVLKG